MSLIILNVDEVRRTLSASGGAFVVHDKEVDIVRFAINSGFADIVLDGQVALRVMYQRPGETEVRAQTLTYYDTDGLRNYYDWQLLPSDLAKKGTITCALCILRTDSTVEEWHTTPYQIRVLNTIHTDDSDEADESITPTVAQRVAVLEAMVQRVASGAPIVVSSTSAMTDTTQIYVLSTDGNWYYHNGSTWVSGGTYGAVATDTTLSQSGIPADAKAVGEEISELKSITERTEGGQTNILNPEWLGTGTIRNVSITRNFDEFIYNGTGSGTDSISSQQITAFKIGKTYALKVYTNSTSKINISVRFYNSNNSMISMESFSNYLNTTCVFTVPDNTAYTDLKIGVLSDVTYSNSSYYISVQQGTSNDSYRPYGEGNLTAVDSVARSDIENLENNASFLCYVSPSGADNNSGKSSGEAFATIQHAIDLGFKRIMLAAGAYKNQTVTINNKDGIEIVCNSTSTESGLFDNHARRTRAVLDNSIDVEDFVQYENVYKTQLSVDADSSFYKVFVSKTLDPIYSGAGYYGRVTTYNAILWEIGNNILNCTRLIPKLTLNECKSTAGSFFYDGTDLYVNPTDRTVNGKKYKRLAMDTNESLTVGFKVSNSTNIIIRGLNIEFFPYYEFQAYNVSGLEMHDCKFMFGAYGAGSNFSFCDGDMWYCTAAQTGADGFNITTGGNCNFHNCNGMHCYDDGISHHDASTGMIDGGEWAYNYKGGVVPSFGSIVNVKNVFAHNNRQHGIIYGQSGDRTTDAVQMMQNCLALDNSISDISSDGYDVIAVNCNYRTKSVTNGGALTEYGCNVIN